VSPRGNGTADGCAFFLWYLREDPERPQKRDISMSNQNGLAVWCATLSTLCSYQSVHRTTRKLVWVGNARSTRMNDVSNRTQQ
jgi:hypothetical protein